MLAITVHLHSSSHAPVPNQALIDSGAEWTVLPLSVAQSFDLDIDKMPTGSTRAGGGPLPLKLWNPGGTLRFRAPGLEQEMLELQVVRFADIPVPLLGRTDFFAKFYVTIDGKAEKCWVRRHH